MFDFWKRWKKRDPYTIFQFIVKQIVNYIIAATLNYIGRKLLGRDRSNASTPDLQAQSRQIMQPNSPRQVGYGDFWVSPRIVAAGNPTGSNAKYAKQDTAGGSYRGYSMLLAFTDHPVQFHRVLINNEDFFTGLELARMNRSTPVICSFYDGATTPADFVPLVAEHQTSRTETRLDANTRAREASRNESTVQYSMVIVPKLYGAVRPTSYTPPGQTQSVPVFRYHPFTGDERQWYQNSSYTLWRNIAGGYNDSGYNFGERDTMAPQFDKFGTKLQLGAYLWWYGGGMPDNFHAYGTSTFHVTLPIGFQHDVPPIWPSPPQFRAKAHRPLNTLRLWDETVPGNPKINPEWEYNNAALCTYDYLVRYTPFGRTVCGYSRIDLASVAHAAQVCHEQGFKANGVFNLGNSPQDILGQLEYAMGAGSLTEQNGIAYIYAGERTLPTYSYDNDEIVENSWAIAPTPAREDRRGMIDVAYTQESDGSLQSMPTENPLAQDALQITQSQFMFINNAPQAARMAFVLNSRSWETESLSFRLQAGVPIPRVWDMVYVDLGDAVGISGTYRVMEAVEDPETGETEISAISERENLYSISAQTLLDNANYIPPPAPDKRDGEVNLIIGETAEGENIYLETRSGVRLQINAPQPADNDPTNENEVVAKPIGGDLVGAITAPWGDLLEERASRSAG